MGIAMAGGSRPLRVLTEWAMANDCLWCPQCDQNMSEVAILSAKEGVVLINNQRVEDFEPRRDEAPGKR